MRWQPFVGGCVLALGLSIVAACNNSADDPKDRVSQALEQANIDDVNLDYDSDGRVLHLKGTVGTQAERQQATEIAERAVGTSGTVLNELTVEGIDESSANDADGRIREQLNGWASTDPTLKAYDIDFDVRNGAVEIKGSVPTAADKQRVTDMARSLPDVRDVANALEIKASK